MAIAVIVTVGLFFLGMGVYALAAPSALVRPFTVSLQSATARSEVRAVYGGFGLAMAAMLAVAAVHPDLRRPIVFTIAAALGGMALGRAISGLIDSRTAFYPNWFYFLFESVAAGALVWAA